MEGLPTSKLLVIGNNSCPPPPNLKGEGKARGNNEGPNHSCYKKEGDVMEGMFL